jgi:Acetyltransferase (GNAT) domain
MRAKQSPDILAASSSLHVIEVDPQTDPRWEALLTSIPASSIYYHPAGLQVMEEAYGYKPIHLACEDATGQVVGILPLFYQRGWRSGRIFRSVFTGPLAYDDQITAALMRAAVERTHAEPGAQLHLKITSNAFDGLLDGVVGAPMYETYLLALPERPDLLRLDSALKRAINKATRLDVQVRQAQTERELRAWYGLYLQTMRKLVALPNPYRYYKVAWRRLHSKGLLRLLLAERIEAGRRRLLGGILLLLYGQTVSFASAGWREEDQALRPNDVLHWRAIQDACTDGFRWYDFGDVALGNQGLARYKSKWGAEAKMVYDYSYPSHYDGMSSAHDPSRNPAHQLVHAAWQHLPTKAVGLLSEWYYALHLY